MFGGAMVDGLRGIGQDVHWITDDDSTVSTDDAKGDAIALMRGLLHRYPDEHPELGLGIASQFDDNLRAEDLVAIPDLAAGAFSEMLTRMGKANMPTSGSGLTGMSLLLQIKTSLINAWRSETGKPLKHMNAVVRAADAGQMILSFGGTFTGILPPGECAEGAPMLPAKWRRALESDLKARGIDPDEMLRSIGIDI